jgi:hypothetical protein
VDPQLLELAALFQSECRYVVSVEQLLTKVRLNLKGGYVFDVFYRAKTGNYSYTLVKEEKRVVGWDNAPHYEELASHPHHFHQEDGTVVASTLGSDPASNTVAVARAVNAMLEKRGVAN